MYFPNEMNKTYILYKVQDYVSASFQRESSSYKIRYFINPIWGPQGHKVVQIKEKESPNNSSYIQNQIMYTICRCCSQGKYLICKIHILNFIITKYIYNMD